MRLGNGGIAGLWLRLTVNDGENAGRAMMLPHDRVVAIMDLEGGAGLAFDDGGTMQVRETAAELAELLELAFDGSVMGLSDLEPLRAERERRRERRKQAHRMDLYGFDTPVNDQVEATFEEDDGTPYPETPELRARRVERVGVPLEPFMPPFVPSTRRVHVVNVNPVMLEPGGVTQLEAPTRAGDTVQRMLLQVTARTSSGEAVTDCEDWFQVASPDLFANANKVPAAMFSSANVPALGNFYRKVTGPVKLEVSSSYHLPAYVLATLFVQREE